MQPDVRGLFLLDRTSGVEALPDSLGSRLSAFSIPLPVKDTLDVAYLPLLYIRCLTLLQSTSILRVKLFHSLPWVPHFRELFILSDSRQRSFFELFQHGPFPKPPKDAEAVPASHQVSVCTHIPRCRRVLGEEQGCPLERQEFPEVSAGFIVSLRLNCCGDGN